jgi:hypothetical protein
VKAGATAVDPRDIFLWQQDVQEAKKRISLLLENKKHVYALNLGQCLSELDSTIKGLDANVQADTNQDVVQLLVIIRLGGGTDKNVIFFNGPKIDSELSNMLSYLTIRCLECFVEKFDHNLTVGCLKD